MSEYADHVENDQDLPITYSINIKTLSTLKRPLTCYITTDKPSISKQRTLKQLNYTKTLTSLEKTSDCHIKSLENTRRSSIHLPVTYSTSIHVPCHSSTITPRPAIILPSQSSHHHYHYYHHYHHHHYHRQPSSPPLSSRPSTTIKHKISPQPRSISSTRPTTTSTTTMTSPESLLSAKKLNTKSIHLSSPMLTSDRHKKQPPPPPLLQLPSYSTLVWNWFHHMPAKSSSHHKGSQSDYSEMYRHELPSKRSLLFKFFTSPIDKQSKSKHHGNCFNRKRLQSSSSSSLPNKTNNYNE